MSGETQVLLFSSRSGHSSTAVTYNKLEEDTFANYPAPISSNRLHSPPKTGASSKYLPSLPKYRDTSHSVKAQNTWDISLVASVIFAIICIIPAPICSIATFILTHQAIKAGNRGRFRKRDIKKNWSLCCSMISFIIGALTLASLSTLIGFAISYW